MKPEKPCPSLPNENGFCGGTALGCPAQQCGIDEDISPYGELCRKMQDKARRIVKAQAKPQATVCPKFGKSSRGVEKCMARNGSCDERHTDRICPIKPAKREGDTV